MKHPKKQYLLHGDLLCPLAVGRCAAFMADGQVYRTSPVVVVECADSRLAVFETQNSRYSLSLSPFPPAAMSLAPARLAACA